MKFLGYEDFVEIICFWSSHLGHFYAFYGLILESRYRMGMFFAVAKISNTFGGMPDFFFFFFFFFFFWQAVDDRSKLT